MTWKELQLLYPRGTVARSQKPKKQNVHTENMPLIQMVDEKYRDLSRENRSVEPHLRRGWYVQRSVSRTSTDNS
jgi:hypothetical protein